MEFFESIVLIVRAYCKRRAMRKRLEEVENNLLLPALADWQGAMQDLKEREGGMAVFGHFDHHPEDLPTIEDLRKSCVDLRLKFEQLYSERAMLKKALESTEPVLVPRMVLARIS